MSSSNPPVMGRGRIHRDRTPSIWDRVEDDTHGAIVVIIVVMEALSSLTLLSG